ncbi:MAG: hypothetical protein MRY79_04550 [Alphaproteobacteria bacterium]|nr:hypothetical protein [Alphaproteobacteria bacterium]
MTKSNFMKIFKVAAVFAAAAAVPTAAAAIVFGADTETAIALAGNMGFMAAVFSPILAARDGKMDQMTVSGAAGWVTGIASSLAVAALAFGVTGTKQGHPLVPAFKQSMSIERNLTL